MNLFLSKLDNESRPAHEGRDVLSGDVEYINKAVIFNMRGYVGRDKSQVKYFSRKLGGGEAKHAQDKYVCEYFARACTRCGLCAQSLKF